MSTVSIKSGQLFVRSARQYPPPPPAPPPAPFALQPVGACKHEIRFAGETATFVVHYEYTEAERFAALYHRLFLQPQAPLATAPLSGPQRLDLVEALIAAL